MSENDNEELDSTNQATEEVENTNEVEETDDQSGTEDLEALQEKNKRLFERAKKAEAEAKILKAERLKKEEQAKVQPKADKPSEKQDVQLTPMDAIMLSKANITEADDIEEVLAYANFRKIPVKDALKDKTMKTILAERAEQRQTAEATNTGNARRGSSKLTDEQVVANADTGKLPDDAGELARASNKAKLNKKK